ncbi:MAG: N-acetyltransferase [Anaerolineae bacterium]
MSLEVRKVETQADFKAFFEFPWTLYKDDPNWVPPLLSMRSELLDQKKHPCWEYMEGDYFGAWRGDKLVGTITAFINHRHNDFHGEHIGWFGTFDVYDDQEAASALLDKAAEWVKAKGYTAIRGPQNFTTHDECGLLVDNFSRPIILMPYNAPYYQRLVESRGDFQKVMDVYSFYWDTSMVADSNAVERLGHVTEKMMKRAKIVIRPLDGKNLKKEFILFKELYNAAWEKNWGFTPMTPAELDALVASLGMFVDPKLAFMAEVNGDPAGFMMAIPDLNQALHWAYAKPGTPELFTLLKAVWYWKIRAKIDVVRLPLMGVKPQYRNKGVDVAMYYYTMKAVLDAGFKSSDAGWILETNTNMVSIAQNTGMKIYKTHRFYEKSLV